MNTLKKRQDGVVILEVLVSIVIFAVGVLGIVGLQAVTAKSGVDARFRTEASGLADELVARAQTWVNPATVATNFAGSNGSGGGEYVSWYTNRLTPATTGLPGGAATVSFPTPYAAAGAGALMTVEISWTVPGSGATSTHTTVAAIPGSGD